MRMRIDYTPHAGEWEYLLLRVTFLSSRHPLADARNLTPDYVGFLGIPRRTETVAGVEALVLELRVRRRGGSLGLLHRKAKSAKNECRGKASLCPYINHPHTQGGKSGF